MKGGAGKARLQQRKEESRNEAKERIAVARCALFVLLSGQNLENRPKFGGIGGPGAAQDLASRDGSRFSGTARRPLQGMTLRAIGGPCLVVSGDGAWRCQGPILGFHVPIGRALQAITKSPPLFKQPVPTAPDS